MFVPLILAATVAAMSQKVDQQYDKVESKQLIPILEKVVEFASVSTNAERSAEQKTWLMAKAKELGFEVHDAGKVIEIELPGPKNAPVLGLVVHSDVQPADENTWAHYPYHLTLDNGVAYGRGVADDKGPLVQALLAMHALRESGIRRTHTIRLLVGSDEESTNTDMTEYLKTHKPPDYSLVLDSLFPVVVGEKAWQTLTVTTTLAERKNDLPYRVGAMWAGSTPSIVPEIAACVLEWKKESGPVDWNAVEAKIKSNGTIAGTKLQTTQDIDLLRVTVIGKAAHSGMNLEAGRNAILGLAQAMNGVIAPGGANDLLDFAKMAGKDLYGAGLGITDNDPLWGRYAVNVATIKPDEKQPDKLTLTINIRRIPPRTGAELKAHLEKVVAEFNQREGSSLQFGGFFDDEPLAFNPNAKLVRRLLADYDAATGTHAKPAISGGGTYAKRLPNAIAFGMWFPDTPYTGHDTDEHESVADLQKGAHVLIRAITDIATGPRIVEPFKP
jgi:predicted dipeptidase